ncbi:MAG: hypothetical protein ACRELC_11580 [Gemmatimonadota bacterium]
MERRPTRTFEIEGRPWLAIVAWRATGGPALCWFVPLDGAHPRDADEADRRAALEPDERLEALDAGALRDRFDGARGLTATERRITDAEGELWLVQNTGPVWAGDAAPEDATGVRFRCLTRHRSPLHTSGGPVAGRTAADLRAELERALARQL